MIWKIIISIMLVSVTIVAPAGIHIGYNAPEAAADSIPAFMKGDFKDDYGIRYSISEKLWTQKPNARYHVMKWNTARQYLIAKNDAKNISDAGLYTRIDYMYFKNMEPYTWGFCLTVYNAASDSLAEVVAQADRTNPRKGCGGFPFSRMKKAE